MKQRLIAQLLAALALLGSACASAPVPYDPFRIPRDQFYGSLKVVAVAPVRGVPADLEDPEAVKGKFAAMIEGQLREAGLRVVPASETGPVFAATATEKGGVFDPVTGKADEAKAKALLEETLRRLKEHFGVDALLRPDIRGVSTRLDRDTAKWDGTTEAAGPGFWKALFSGSYSGRIPALSLVVVLVRLDGTVLYVNAGGLRVIYRVGAGGKAERIPQAELFTDEERNANAVHLALDPLVGKKARE